MNTSSSSFEASDLAEIISIELRISGGSFEQGFYIRSLIFRNGVLFADSKKSQGYDKVRITFPAPEVPRLYEQWQGNYKQTLKKPRSRKSSGFTIPPQTEYCRNLALCSQAADSLKKYLEAWFNTTECFTFLKQWIKLKLQELRISSSTSLPVIFDVSNVTKNEEDVLKKLPWHLWDLFSDLPSAEMVISASADRSYTPLSNPVRIFAIFGSTEGIQLDEDLRALKNLHDEIGAKIFILPTDINEDELGSLRRDFEGAIEILPKNTLSSDPNVNSASQLGDTKTFLHEIHNQLTQSDWDILFFAGHSYSSADLANAYLRIGRGGTVSIDDLMPDLQEAVRRGLKLAIFNSCDGLGIAERLVRINVPTVIVFREPVSDRIARDFLKGFLQRFSKGTPFYLASRIARRDLQWMQGDPQDPYPSATWLPVIYQNYAQPEWIWPQRVNPPKPFLAPLLNLVKKVWYATYQLLPRIRNSRRGAGFISLVLLGLILAVSVPFIANQIYDKFQGQIRPYVSDSPPSDVNRLTATLENEDDGRNQPKVLIDLLNNLSDSSQQEVYRIGVTAEDIEINPKADEQLLRGIAQVQLEQNCQIDFETIRELNVRTLEKACAAEGAKLYIDLQSDYAKEENAKELASNFSAPDILGIVGFSNSRTTFAANQVLEDKKTIIVSPTSTAVRDEALLNGKTGKYVFRTATNDDIATQDLIKFISDRPLQNKSVAIIYEKGEPYSESFTRTFSTKIGEENAVILPECNLAKAPENGSLDRENKALEFASSCLDSIQQASPRTETLLLVPGTTKSSSALTIIRDILENRTPQFSYIMGSDTLYEDELRSIFARFYENNRSDRVNMVIAVPWHRERNLSGLSNSPFQKRAKLIWDTDAVNWQTVTGYDAAKTILEGFKIAQKNGKLNREGLYSALSKGFSVDGATAKIQFDSNGDRVEERDLGVLVQVEPTQTGADFFKSSY